MADRRVAGVLIVAVVLIGAIAFAWFTSQHGSKTNSSNSSSTPPNITSRCLTTNNSIGCLVVNGTQTMGDCRFLPKGRGLYIRLETDSGQPLSNNSILIYYAEPVCPNITVLITEQGLKTNASGWASYGLNATGKYMFSFHYSSQESSFTVVEKTNMTTYATVKLPSGTLSVTYASLVH